MSGINRKVQVVIKPGTPAQRTLNVPVADNWQGDVCEGAKGAAFAALELRRKSTHKASGIKHDDGDNTYRGSEELTGGQVLDLLNSGGVDATFKGRKGKVKPSDIPAYTNGQTATV